jgi:ankyrin repeat protein
MTNSLFVGRDVALRRPVGAARRPYLFCYFLLQIHDNCQIKIQQTCAMKTKFILTILMLLTAADLASAATNDLPTLLQRGLFEEEANHQLDVAIGDYKEAIEHFDHERQLAATAIFRLGECYRKLGRTNEANAQYQRIVREFPDQSQLAQLSRANLPTGAGTATLTEVGAPASPSNEDSFLRNVKESVQNSPDLVNQNLGLAARTGNIPAAEFLIAHGADLNTPYAGWSPIFAATENGNEAMIQLLLSHGTEVNGRGSDGRTALFSAVEKGFMTICRTLVAHGADVNAKDNNGATPLEMAVEQGNLLGAEFLITNKAKMEARENWGDTLLTIAIRRGHSEMVKLLLHNHADANMECQEGGGKRSSPLSLALGQPEMVRLLLEAHADPNAVLSTTSTSGETPLIWASGMGTHAAEVVELLLDHGAKVNVADHGQTPLLHAIRFGRIDVVRMLIEHGADVNFLDKQGAPPLAYLKSPLNETASQIKELLVKAGADPDYNRRRGIWIFDAGGTLKTELFQCPTNSINHYTLLEFLATLYKTYPVRGLEEGYGLDLARQTTYVYDDRVLFPDFARVTIHRLNGKRAEVLRVNIADILQSGDSSKDVALQAGDIVEIAQLEHKVADSWLALSSADVTALNKCLLRTVHRVAQGQTNDIALLPLLGIATPTPFMPGFIKLTPDLETNWQAEAFKGRKPDTIVRSFSLNNVVRDASLLLNTWDLSKVRLTRGGAKIAFDLTSNPPPDVWLEDGDVIEIPDLGEAAPAAEAKETPQTSGLH